MRTNMLLFSVLGYAAAIVGIFPLDLTTSTSWILDVLVAIVMAALVWAGSRGHGWAAALFCILMVFSVWVAIGMVWDGAPAFFRIAVEPGKVVTMWDKITAVLTVVLGLAAMAVYLKDRRELAAQPAA
jgi:hypothetical protein